MKTDSAPVQTLGGIEVSDEGKAHERLWAFSLRLFIAQAEGTRLLHDW